MGLDIYLYQYKNKPETDRLENLYEEFSNKLWEDAGEYDKLTEEQKDEISQKCKEYSKSLGLDDWGTDVTNKIHSEDDHPKYPEHLFKIGYFRSSYNDGGIEKILRNYGLPTLHDVFQADGQYVFQPNWEDALIRIESLISDFDKVGEYRVKPIYTFSHSTDIPNSAEEALKVFLKEKEKEKNNDYNYSSSKGEFNFKEPEEVLAFIPGKCRYIFNDRECVFVITKGHNEWYKQALEIVRDTIKFVLSQKDKEQYYLHWSG